MAIPHMNQRGRARIERRDNAPASSGMMTKVVREWRQCWPRHRKGRTDGRKQGHRDRRKLDDKSGDDRRDQSANEPGRKTFVAPLDLLRDQLKKKSATRAARAPPSGSLAPLAFGAGRSARMSAPDATSREAMASRPSAMPARVSSAVPQPPALSAPARRSGAYSQCLRQRRRRIPAPN